MNGINKISNVLFLFLVAAIASSTFAAIKIAMDSFDQYQITFWRSCIAFIVCIPFLTIRSSISSLKVANWVSIIGISIIGVVIPFTLLNWAGGQIDSALVGILWSTLPIFGVVLSHYLTKNDRIGVGKILGVLLGMFSVYLVTGYDMDRRDWQYLLPHFAVVGAALCYAISGVLQKRLPADLSGLLVTGLTMVISMMLALLLFPLSDFGHKADTKGVIAVIYLGVVTSALLTYMRLALIRRAGYSLVSNTGFLVPVFTMVIGVLLLDEPIPKYGLLALAIAFIAILLGQVSYSKKV